MIYKKINLSCIMIFFLVTISVVFNFVNFNTIFCYSIVYNKSVVQKENKLENFIPVVRQIILKYSNTHDVLFTPEEIEKFDLFYFWPDINVRYLMSSNFSNISSKAILFVLFPEKNFDYKNLLESFTYSSQCYFLISWLHSTTFNFNTFEKISEQFWKYKLLNLAILFRIGKYRISVYSYYPYGNTHCGIPGPPILTHTWNIKKKFSIEAIDLFPSVIDNVYGCKLICFAKNRPPDSIVFKNNHTWILDGVGGKLLLELQKKINFTAIIIMPNLTIPSDKYGYDISGGIPEILWEGLDNGTIDLGFGIYSHIIYDNPTADFSISGVSECYVWAVPIFSGEDLSLWKYYIDEFDNYVWIALASAYLISVIIFHFFNIKNSISSTRSKKISNFELKNAINILKNFQRHKTRQIRKSTLIQKFFQNFDFTALYLLAIILGIPVIPKIRNNNFRILIAPILIGSFITFSAYQSSLGSFLAIPWKRKQIENYYEILEKDFIMTGGPQPGKILKRFSSDNITLKEMSERFVVYKDHIGKLIKKISRDRDTVTFGSDRFIQFYASHELNSYKDDEIYIMKDCVLQAHSSPFLFRKGSPFVQYINKIVLDYIEFGFLKTWYTYSTPKIFHVLEPKYYPLNLIQTKCLFIVLITGHLVAITTFFLELYFYTKTEKRN